jgi:hypothetical protein
MMRRSTLDRLLSPWVFVVTGIVFNILSAVISHYFIGLNNDAINLIDRDINRQQVLIDSLWQSKVEVERKKEFFILLFAQPNDKPAASESVYQNYLQELMTTYELMEFESRMDRDRGNQLGLLLDISTAAQGAIVESINNTYFESLELHEARMPLENDNSRLFSVAIFLQVIGLILVLARDLRRS